MDVNSGSVHVVDDIVYDMIPLVEPLVTEGIKDADTIKAAVLNLANIPYPQEEITEAVDGGLELETAGLTEIDYEGSTLEPAGYGERIILQIHGKLGGHYEIREKRVSTAKN